MCARFHGARANVDGRSSQWWSAPATPTLSKAPCGSVGAGDTRKTAFTYAQSNAPTPSARPWADDKTPRKNPSECWTDPKRSCVGATFHSVTPPPPPPPGTCLGPPFLLLIFFMPSAFQARWRKRKEKYPVLMCAQIGSDRAQENVQTDPLQLSTAAQPPFSDGKHNQSEQCEIPSGYLKFHKLFFMQRLPHIHCTLSLSLPFKTSISKSIHFHTKGWKLNKRDCCKAKVAYTNNLKKHLDGVWCSAFFMFFSICCLTISHLLSDTSAPVLILHHRPEVTLH